MALWKRWSVNSLLLISLVLAPAKAALVAADQDLPYTFFLTRYELIGVPDKPAGIRYHSDGQPFAKAPSGSTIALSGKGGWDPKTGGASGGGKYTIKNANGDTVAQGTWRATGFVFFEQLAGWFPPGFKEYGWQGPRRSVGFSGFLTLKVALEKQGKGVLMLWCLMPTVVKPGDHKSDGMILVGPGFNFTDYHGSEASAHGVMFYSTDPAITGYTLNAQGQTIQTRPRP